MIWVIAFLLLIIALSLPVARNIIGAIALIILIAAVAESGDSGPIAAVGLVVFAVAARILVMFLDRRRGIDSL